MRYDKRTVRQSACIKPLNVNKLILDQKPNVCNLDPKHPEHARIDRSGS